MCGGGVKRPLGGIWLASSRDRRVRIGMYWRTRCGRIVARAVAEKFGAAGVSAGGSGGSGGGSSSRSGNMWPGDIAYPAGMGAESV